MKRRQQLFNLRFPPAYPKGETFECHAYGGKVQQWGKIIDGMAGKEVKSRYYYGVPEAFRRRRERRIMETTEVLYL